MKTLVLDEADQLLQSAASACVCAGTWGRAYGSGWRFGGKPTRRCVVPPPLPRRRAAEHHMPGASQVGAAVAADAARAGSPWVVPAAGIDMSAFYNVSALYVLLTPRVLGRRGWYLLRRRRRGGLVGRG